MSNSWSYVKIIILISWFWAVIQMSVGAYQSTLVEGNWGHLVQTNGSSSSIPTHESICVNSPYSYLSPFAFGLAQDASSITLDKGNPTICPWPESNSAFRIFWNVMQILFLLFLTFENILSNSKASVVCMGIFSFMLMASFCIDANNARTGAAACVENFSGTDLAAVLSNNAISITCLPNNFNGMVVIDLVALINSFVLMMAWTQCDEKFGLGSTGYGGHYDSESDLNRDAIPSNKGNYA